jgi:hypothetical protein
VYLKKAKPLDGLLRERPARHDLPGRNPVVQAQVLRYGGHRSSTPARNSVESLP